jgi:hypothetical protein
VLPSTFSDANGWFATTNTAFEGENVERTFSVFGR